MSRAGVLTDASCRTPGFVRFSTVQEPGGSADAVCDVRDFVVKMYTDKGNRGIGGNNIPVFLIQESIKFVDLVHAVKPEPDKEVPTTRKSMNSL